MKSKILLFLLMAFSFSAAAQESIGEREDRKSVV